ncbi:MAG: hypothetical protein ACYCW6_05565 [Candidatus Xenobia bacterium]
MALSAVTHLQVSIVEPLVLRFPGMPFSRLLEPVTQETLWQLLDDPTFVDCLATMNHAAFPSLHSRRARMVPGKRPSDIRRAELTLYRYLTRFCSRNDTTGTAGSTIWGSLGERDEVSSGSRTRRFVWPSPRHLEVLSHRMAYGEMRAQAMLTLVPRLVWDGRTLVDTHRNSTIPLLPNQRALLDRVPCPFGVLDEREQAVATRLLDQRWLVLRLDQPPEIPELARLQAALAQASGLEFAALMTQAEAIADRICGYRMLDLDGVSDPRVSLARPMEPTWGSAVAAEAELAARPDARIIGLDRSFFICDSAPQDGALVLGEALRSRIEAELSGWFRLVAWQEFQREQLLRHTLAALPQKEMALSRFLYEVGARAYRDKLDQKSAELNALRMRLVEEDDAQWTASGDPLQRLELHETRASDAFEVWLRDKRFVSTVDVMLSKDGSVLVSEAHCGGDHLHLTTFFPQAHPERSFEGFGRALFGADMLLLQPAWLCKQSEGILRQLQDLVLVVQNAEGWWPQSRWLPIGAVRVRPEGDIWVVHDGQQQYRLITESMTFGNIRTVSYSPRNVARWAASKLGPLDAERLPEVALGDLVVARRSRRLKAARALELVQQRQLDMPRFTFVTTTGKPMLCDLESPCSLEVLTVELSRSETATFSPMQPGPDDLWLGDRTSEIRMVMLCDGPQFVL